MLEVRKTSVSYITRPSVLATSNELKMAVSGGGGESVIYFSSFSFSHTVLIFELLRFCHEYIYLRVREIATCGRVL